MGLNAPLIYSSLKLYSNAGEFNFNGPAFDQLAWAIAHAVAEWIDNPSNVALAGLAAGTAGVGYIPEHTSHLIVLPVVPLMTMSMEAAGMNGPLMPSLSIVVTLAISHVITQFGGYTGICPTVGVGTDMSKVVIANVGALVEQLVQEMKGQNMTGPANLRMANGLGMGIAALVLTGFGWGVVVGVPSPVPSSGPSLSKVG
jgi:hypothetical protein